MGSCGWVGGVADAVGEDAQAETCIDVDRGDWDAEIAWSYGASDSRRQINTRQRQR